MEIKTKETVITQKIYIAKDGQEFQNESACKRYEILLDLQNKKWFKSKIEKYKGGKYSILNFNRQVQLIHLIIRYMVIHNIPIVLDTY